MPQASYRVYVSDDALNDAVERYCEDKDSSESGLFRAAVGHFLYQEGYL